MRILSTVLGELEIEESSIINFPDGIPAFEKEKQFVIIPMDEGGPFYYLQSVANPDLCLILAQPFTFFPKYEMEIADEDLARLKMEPGSSSLAIYVVLTVPDDFRQTTANLLAPIIINSENRLAMQYIAVKSSYTTRHPIFPAENRAAAAGEGR